MSQKAQFALGCFWDPDEKFSKVNGVISTTAGYSGGTTLNPNYENIGDHSETVLIEFDPNKITYDELLKKFWQLHDSTKKFKTQYRSAIFYLDEGQKLMAEESKMKFEDQHNVKVATSIEPAKNFYKAEEYHQKYLRKCRM